MKYFIDTEFMEDFHKPLFGKKRHFIDFISIGIVSEDGLEFYAISKDFDLKAVWNKYDLGKTGKCDLPGINRSIEKVYWLRDNVLRPIFEDLHSRFLREEDYKGSVNMEFTYGNLKYLINRFGKSNKQIAEEVFQFCTDDVLTIEKAKHYKVVKEGIEFLGYYCDYDWCLFCSLFGRMIDLPAGFPMYCIDLKQTFDEAAIRYFEPVNPGGQHLEDRVRSLKNHPDYPRQENEHSALCDTRWNKKLYEFLQTI